MVDFIVNIIKYFIGIFDWFFSKIFLRWNVDEESMNSVDDYIDKNFIEKPCQPHVDYNSSMDTLRVFWNCDTDWYVDSLKENPTIELIKEFDTDRIVGVSIRNVQKVLSEEIGDNHGYI